MRKPTSGPLLAPHAATMVAVAQLVESRIVIPVVVGSNPISHPILHVSGVDRQRPPARSSSLSTSRTAMPQTPESPSPAREVEDLVAELEQAEAYEQRLRQLIARARDELAAGHTSIALSLLNEALSDIDDAADVVATTDPRRSVK